MNRSMLVFAFACALIGVSASRRVCAAQEGRVAYVDLQRALEETDEGKAAKAKLKAEFEKKQKELDDKQEELKKMKEELDKKQAVMKPDALAKEQKAFQDRFVELQNIYGRLQKDLNTKEQEATRGILARMGQVVQRIAERDHFSMVVERQALIYGQPSLDITNEVIRTYNAGAGGGTKKSK